jgi:hypothetical protein
MSPSRFVRSLAHESEIRTLLMEIGLNPFNPDDAAVVAAAT